MWKTVKVLLILEVVRGNCCPNKGRAVHWYNVTYLDNGAGFSNVFIKNNIIINDVNVQNHFKVIHIFTQP